MTRKPARERGQVLVITALFMVVLLLTAALAIDYSSWLVSRRDYQGVVDAASLAGAAQLPPPGDAAATLPSQQHAAIEALVYLSDHLGWGISRATATTTVGNYLNQTAPYVVAAGSGLYCVWIWTPVPSSTTATSADPRCEPLSSTLYSPPTFANSSHKVFVRVQSPRPSYFSGIAGIHNELVSAIAVAGGAISDYAVITLKPRLGSPDNQLALTINGNTTKLVVPEGNIGSNYSATCSSASAVGMISFPDPTFEQTVDLEEPSVTSCSGLNVSGGAIQQLPDYPIPDPAYFSPPPSWCSGAPSGECQEAGVNWPAPPSAIYPPCADATDISKHQITKCNSGTFTIYPGKYEYIVVPNGATATLSPNCFGDAADLVLNPGHTSPDTDCINNDRAGVYYFTSNAPNEGVDVNNGGSLYGCGVLVMLDPNEGGATGKMQFSASGSGATVGLNDPAIPGGCSMKWDPGSPTGKPFVWYGYNSPYENPVTMWVRPNGNGYNLTGSNNGSHVIKFTSNATLDEGGAIYGPQDNTEISGGPAGSGVGQIVAWTVTYSGGTDINETFQGPFTIRARLVQ